MRGTLSTQGAQAPSGSGYDFLVVDWSTEEKRRFVISVDPNSGYHLRGLGAALEREESRERARLGVPRPAEPRRLPADNSDPWFFGQGHGYTIVDAPFAGTVLDADAVRRVHTSWTPDA